VKNLSCLPVFSVGGGCQESHCEGQGTTWNRRDLKNEATDLIENKRSACGKVRNEATDFE